jgi:hypothetical protein
MVPFYFPDPARQKISAQQSLPHAGGFADIYGRDGVAA